MWPFKRKRDADLAMLGSYREAEAKRQELHTQVELKKLELEARKTELELDHLEARNKADIETMKAREEIRELRRKNAAKSREQLAQRRAEAAQLYGYRAHGNCRTCINPSNPGLTAPEINWHNAGHPKLNENGIPQVSS